MAFINKQDKQDNLITPISNIFIDKYMLEANSLFVKVYLYGYRNCYHGIYDLTSRQIADNMDILETDVILAWKYWEEKGLIKLYYNDTTLNYDVEYLHIDNNSQSKTINETKFNSISTKPQYSPQELNIYKNTSEEIKDLFSYSQKTLNKILSYNDLNVIFSLYDWLRLPIEIIKMLLAYYCDKSMKYIEKVAIDWAENNIDTIDKAEERISLYGEYRQIMKAFGFYSRMSIPKEEEYMRKWLKTYKFPLEIIVEACKKTVMQSPNGRYFSYADGIITSWYENKVKTLDDILKLEQAFLEKKNKDNNNKLSNPSNLYSHKRVNKFINYEQREWDFEELERLERQYIDKNLGR